MLTTSRVSSPWRHSAVMNSEEMVRESFKDEQATVKQVRRQEYLMYLIVVKDH